MPHKHIHSKRMPLARMYEYRRMVPHYLKAGSAVFITFCKNYRGEPFSAEARDAILQCILKGNNYRFRLHAAVVMPEHAASSSNSSLRRGTMGVRPTGNFEIIKRSIGASSQQSSSWFRACVCG